MRRNLLRMCALACALALVAGAAAEELDLLAVDHRLYELGYRDGACTGELNGVMINALRNFQTANALGVTGEPDAGTLLVLESDAAVSQSAYLEGLAHQSAGMPALASGTAGDGVLRLQQALEALGYFEGESDGAFGDATAEAVRRFQFANGLPVNGVADASLFLRLYGTQPTAWADFLDGSAAAIGDSGPSVRALQYWLRGKGYFDGECTGVYGESTQRAVRSFQSAAGLEASGNADADTCRALYGDVTALVADASAPRRGSEGAEELCRGLTSLGYAAHERFDMQTELALMQFQWANWLEVTGRGDAATMARLSAADAVRFSDFRGSGAELTPQQDLGTRLVRQAAHMLGERSGFDEEFGLIQYAYLKCGVAILERGQFKLVSAEPGDARPGDVMVLQIGGEERCGLTGSDGAIYYRDADGRVVMGYPASMGAESMRLYRVDGQ